MDEIFTAIVNAMPVMALVAAMLRTEIEPKKPKSPR